MSQHINYCIDLIKNEIALFENEILNAHNNYKTNASELEKHEKEEDGTYMKTYCDYRVRVTNLEKKIKEFHGMIEFLCSKC